MIKNINHEEKKGTKGDYNSGMVEITRTHPVRDEIFVAHTDNFNLHPVGMRYHISIILSHPYGMVICFFVCATNILSLTGQFIP